jgi:shikimate kinase
MTKKADSKELGQALKRPIILIGMMGAGKTTVGRRLATALDIPFFDADMEIERAAGMQIADIFETYGEEEFRNGEMRVIERLLSQEKIHVLATGGGAFIRPETRALIQEKAISVWLKADIDILLTRTAKRDTRPLLRQGNPREILEQLSRQRDPIYTQARITVESIKGPHKEIVDRILHLLQSCLHQQPAPPQSDTSQEATDTKDQHRVKS